MSCSVQGVRSTPLQTTEDCRETWQESGWSTGGSKKTGNLFFCECISVFLLVFGFGGFWHCGFWLLVAFGLWWLLAFVAFVAFGFCCYLSIYPTLPYPTLSFYLSLSIYLSVSLSLYSISISPSLSLISLSPHLSIYLSFIFYSARTPGGRRCALNPPPALSIFVPIYPNSTFLFGSVYLSFISV